MKINQCYSLLAMMFLSLFLVSCSETGKQSQEQAASETSSVSANISIVDVPIKETRIRALMDQLYGKDQFWEKHQCWLKILLVEGQSQTYCMRPLDAKEVSVDKEKRLYLQTTGNLKNDDPNGSEDFASYHAAAGAFGAFILDENSTESKIIAALPVEQFGAWGIGPEKPFSLVQLSNKGDFGWLGESSYSNQGVTESWMALFTLVDKEIKQVNANVPGSYDDSANDDQNYQTKTYNYRFDSSKEQNGFYPMMISEVFEKNGQKQSERDFNAYFDPIKKVYSCSDKSCLGSETEEKEEKTVVASPENICPSDKFETFLKAYTESETVRKAFWVSPLKYTSLEEDDSYDEPFKEVTKSITQFKDLPELPSKAEIAAGSFSIRVNHDVNSNKATATAYIPNTGYFIHFYFEYLSDKNACWYLTSVDDPSM